MPIVHISILEGRDSKQKARLISAVTEAVVDALDAPAESIRVLINEVPKEHWGIAGLSAAERDNNK